MSLVVLYVPPLLADVPKHLFFSVVTDFLSCRSSNSQPRCRVFPKRYISPLDRINFLQTFVLSALDRSQQQKQPQEDLDSQDNLTTAVHVYAERRNNFVLLSSSCYDFETQHNTTRPSSSSSSSSSSSKLIFLFVSGFVKHAHSLKKNSSVANMQNIHLEEK